MISMWVDLFMRVYLLIIPGSNKDLNRAKRTPLKELFSTNVKQCSTRPINKVPMKRKQSAAHNGGYINGNVIDNMPQASMSATGNYK